MNRRHDVWVLCGLAIGLLLILVRWGALRAEGNDLQRRVDQAQAEYDELEPIVQEVKGLKTMQGSLESLISDLARRHRLFQVATAALEVADPGVALERLGGCRRAKMRGSR